MMSYNISHVLSHVGACEDGCRYVPEPFNFLGAFSIFLGTTLRSTRKHAAPAHVAPPSGLGPQRGSCPSIREGVSLKTNVSLEKLLVIYVAKSWETKQKAPPGMVVGVWGWGVECVAILGIFTFH